MRWSERRAAPTRGAASASATAISSSACCPAVGHAVLRIPWVSLPNIILGRGVIPELFLRREATAERLAASAIELIETPGALEAQRSAFRDLAAEIGEPGVAQRAAARVLSVISAPPGRLEGIGVPVTLTPRLAGAS